MGRFEQIGGTVQRMLACLGLLLALSLACESKPASDGTLLAYGSSDDVRAILQANGVEAGLMTCANPGSRDGQITRAVACTLALAPTEIDTLVARVPLAAGESIPYGEINNCVASMRPRALDPRLEVLVGENTRVTNGVGRIELHVVRATGVACVEIHYPWN